MVAAGIESSNDITNTLIHAVGRAMRIRSIAKVALLVVLIALGGAAAVLLGDLSTRPSYGFRYTVAPHVFVETKVSGEQISHQGYQAHLTPLGEATELCMTANAQALLDGQLRAKAEQDGKTQVWFTYYTDMTRTGDQTIAKTFRVIFVREGDHWRRL